MARYLLVTAVGQDRPGLVAGLTAVLRDSGCSVEDSTMTRLRGDFAMMLLVRHPDAPLEPVMESLEAVGHGLNLALNARELGPEEVKAAPESGETFHINVYGADRTGIVYSISTVLAERGANITDLRTTVAGAPDRPIYVMLIEATAAPDEDPAAFTAAVSRAGAQMDVDVTVQQLDPVAL